VVPSQTLLVYHNLPDGHTLMQPMEKSKIPAHRFARIFLLSQGCGFIVIKSSRAGDADPGSLY